MNRTWASSRQLAVLVGLAGLAVTSVVVAAGMGRVDEPSGPAVLPQEQNTEAGDQTEAPTEGATDLDAVEFRVSTYEVFLARDPFEPVVPEPVADGGGGTTSPTTAPTTSPTTSPTGTPTTSPTTSPTGNPTSNPTTSPTGNPTTGPTGEECVQGAATVCDGHHVALVDVFTGSGGQPMAAVRVDNVLYEVEVNEQFATSFLVRSIEPPCVTLVFGDDAFTLCEGESVLK